MTPTNPGVSRVGGRPPRFADRLPRPGGDDVELALACALLIAMGVAGLYFMARPGPTWLDRFVFSLIPPRPRSAYVIAVSRLGSGPVVGVGALAAFLATIRRDRARAIALLAGPLVTVAACDWIVKPVVGRRFDGVLSFPSGSVAAVGALATIAVLATPDRWRWGAGVVGGTLSALMAVAVVALGWHYPTDTLGGFALGIGAVLLLDWAARRLHAVWAPAGHVDAGRRLSGREGTGSGESSVPGASGDAELAAKH